jgi:hypothetical protein
LVVALAQIMLNLEMLNFQPKNYYFSKENIGKGKINFLKKKFKRK